MENKMDMAALFKIGYGLYVVTSNDGKKDNGLIVNTVMQVTDSPKRIAVAINKSNYSHDVIKNSGKMNVNCLTTEAPFKVFEAFGFKSGRDTDKFEGCSPSRSENGLVYLPRYINAYISLSVESYVDLGTHGMFICSVEEAQTISNTESMTYSFYHANVKPKPKAESKKSEKKRYICTVCGFIYEGDELPQDYECPICKHGREVFEEME
ncbi:MAG: flavin reductase [Clostridia bacterium]|nr:flavin reductase [Clostridia bacterium]